MARELETTSEAGSRQTTQLKYRMLTFALAIYAISTGSSNVSLEWQIP